MLNRKFARIGVLFVSFLGSAWAQRDLATLTGTITDSTGSVVPGCESDHDGGSHGARLQCHDGTDRNLCPSRVETGRLQCRSGSARLQEISAKGRTADKLASVSASTSLCKLATRHKVWTWLRRPQCCKPRARLSDKA